MSVAPVRGGTHFLCRRKESKQRKRAHTASLEAGPLAWRGQWNIWNRCLRTLRARDKAVIPPAALRAPSRSLLYARSCRSDAPVQPSSEGTPIQLNCGLYALRVRRAACAHLRAHSVEYSVCCEAKPSAVPRTLGNDPSGEHVMRGGRYDCLVTEAECARAPIPDAPRCPPSQGTRL